MSDYRHGSHTVFSIQGQANPRHDLHVMWPSAKSIIENIDTTTSGGKLIFHIFGALAEFGRDIITHVQGGRTAKR